MISIITACTATVRPGETAISGTGIAFLYIFLVIFAFAWVSFMSDTMLHHGI